MNTKFKKAATLKELIKNLNPNIPISKDFGTDQFYVPLYEHEIKKLLQRIEISENEAETFFITGQIGSGKTSAIYRIKEKIDYFDPNLNSKFSTIYISAQTELDLDDINIIDILIIIGYKIAEKFSAKDAKQLTAYLNKLDQIKSKNEGKLEIIKEEIKDTELEAQTEMGISAGFKLFNFIDLKGNLTAKISTEKNFRKILREIFVLDKAELYDLINKLIEEYTQKTKKRLVLFIDELEKIRDINSASHLFIDELPKFIRQLNLVKILTYPIAFHTSINHLPGYVPFLCTLRIDPVPHKNNNNYDPDKDKTIIENKKRLKQVIYKRIAGDPDKLIDEKAIDLAISKSGGNLKIFLRLLYNAGFEAIEEGKITEAHVQTAIKDERLSLSLTLTDPELLKFLNDIAKYHKPFQDLKDKFLEATLNNLIYFFKNDDIWYLVNPLIEDTLKSYSI